MKKRSFFVLTALMSSIMCMPLAIYAGDNSEGLDPIEEREFHQHMSDLDSELTAGDVNMDQTVNLDDVQIVLKYALSIDEGTELQKFVADEDGNGQINLDDVCNVLKVALSIDEEKQISGMPGVNLAITSFIEDMGDSEWVDTVTVIRTQEELQQYVKTNGKTVMSQAFEDAGYTELLNKGRRCLMITRVMVNTDNLEQIKHHARINGTLIQIEINENEIKNLDSNHYLTVVRMVENETINKNQGISLFTTKTDRIVNMLYCSGEGNETATIDQATEFRHVIRNTTEQKVYFEFLEKTFSVEDMQEIFASLKPIQQTAYANDGMVFFTWFTPSGNFEYQIASMQKEDDTLHITLDYVDKNEAGIPSEKRCVVIAGIQVGQKVLEGIEAVKLTVQE